MTPRRKVWQAFLLAILVGAGCGWANAGEPRQLQLRWGELQPRITNRKVSFVLPDGTSVAGKVLAVEPDGLRMKISKSSNRDRQPKGKHLVARQGISLLQVTEYRKTGRIVGTLGAVGIAAGIIAAQDIDVYEGPAVIIVPAVIAVGMAGAAVGGYFAGKAFDKRVTEIRIVP